MGVVSPFPAKAGSISLREVSNSTAAIAELPPEANFRSQSGYVEVAVHSAVPFVQAQLPTNGQARFRN